MRIKTGDGPTESQVEIVEEGDMIGLVRAETSGVSPKLRDGLGCGSNPKRALLRSPS